MAVLIERLSDLPSDCFAALVVESEQAGWRCVRRLVEEWANGANRFDRPGEALFAALLGGGVIGVCGLNVDPYAAAQCVGGVRHLYVLSAYRRLGIGRQLVGAVIEAASSRFDKLRVRTGNPAAAQLYERLGKSVFTPQRTDGGAESSGPRGSRGLIGSG